jgi:drug/metabolite transporter (DMT)-like permease
MSRRGWVLFMSMGLIWGVPYLLIKVAVEELTPATLVFGRTALGALILLPLALARGQVRPLLPKWRPLVMFAAVEVAIPWWLLSSAEQHLTSSLTGLLLAAVPLVSAVLAVATRSESLGVRRVVGLLVGIVGVAALVGLDVSRSDPWAFVQMAGVAVGYAVGPYILSRHMSDLPGVGVVAASLTLTALVYLPLAIVQRPAHWPSTNVIGAVVGLAVLCTAIAFVVFFALIEEVGPVRATVITYINPAVAVSLGVLVLDEPLTSGILIGFALVLVGSVLATRRAPATAPAPAPG